VADRALLFGVFVAEKKSFIRSPPEVMATTTMGEREIGEREGERERAEQNESLHGILTEGKGLSTGDLLIKVVLLRKKGK
jgi:hypothetical protein